MKSDIEDFSMFASKISFGDKKEKNNIDLKTINVIKKGLIKDLNEVIEIKDSRNDKCNEHVKLDGNLFQYDGTAIHIIFEDNKPWFRGKDIANVMEYKNTKEAISYNVSKKDTKQLKDFKGRCGLPSKGSTKLTKYINTQSSVI